MYENMYISAHTSTQISPHTHVYRKRELLIKRYMKFFFWKKGIEF